MINAKALAANSTKQSLASRWVSMKRRFEKGQEVAAEMGLRVGTTGATTVAFGGLYYWKKKRQKAGKRITFDKKGKIDGFFWPGLGVAVLGISPLFGVAGRAVAGIGTGAMAVGMTTMIDNYVAKN